MNASESYQKEVARICLDRKWRLAVAESCTGGLLGGRITSVPGSSAYFLGGVVAYSNSLKVSLLRVDPDLIQRHGAVSGEVALAMAEGIVTLTGADAGISITGVAGPDGTDQKPPGTVYVAVRIHEESSVRVFHLEGNREAVRDAAASKALGMFLEHAGNPGT